MLKLLHKATMNIAFLLLTGVMASPVFALTIGTAAPDFNLPGVKDPVTLASFKGKLVYVDFWASWCGPCKQSFPFMNTLQTKYKAQGFEIIAINVDAKTTDATAFLSKIPANFTVAFDNKGDTPKRYAVKAMPSSYLIGHDGKVLVVHQGFKAADEAEIEKRITDALLVK